MNEQVRSFTPFAQEELAWLGTDPVPTAPYYDPAYFELERQAVFLRSWLHVGHVCELPNPGSFVRREIAVANASLLIVRAKDGAIRAFHNVCPHRGTQLVDAESGRQSTFSCPYHRWTFGSDGRLLSAPDFESFHIDKADCSLRPVAVDLCAGMMFVNFSAKPAPLRDYLGALAEQLEVLPVASATTFTEYTYEIDANWKLVADNFQENYHLRFIHPKSGGIAVGPENPFGYAARFDFYDPHRTQTIWRNPTAAAPLTALTAFRAAMAAATRKGLSVSFDEMVYFALFPNLFLLGSSTAPFSHTIFPISATRSRGAFRLYWVGDDDSASERFAREYTMASVRDVHSEDRDVILAGQKGLKSDAIKVIHFQAQEALCRHLYNNVRDRVDAFCGEAEPAPGAM